MIRGSYYTPVTVDSIKLSAAYEKAKRNYDIVKRAINGEKYEAIGIIYGLSRQRIEQIIKRLSLNS